MSTHKGKIELTRESIMDGSVRRWFAKADPTMQVKTDEEHAVSIAAMLKARPGPAGDISFSGRSRTCPIEARTSKRSPRNRFRVRAFAGDSTMISPCVTALSLFPLSDVCSPGLDVRAGILRPFFAAAQRP